MILRRTHSGFTLLEMIVVIVITGIISAGVAIFLRSPIQQYLDVGMRAEMTDVADTALRRIGRDMRAALPNSVKLTTSGCTGANNCTIEFIPTSGGGRYRAGSGGTQASYELDFTTADTGFEVFGPVPSMAANSDSIVIYNLGSTGSDAYNGDNRSLVTNVSGAIVTISAKLFPYDSPGHRFFVVSSPVTYKCDMANKQLVRISGYGWTENTSSGSTAVLAKNVSSCLFTYDSYLIAQRDGLVTMRLSIAETSVTGSTDTVNLYQEIHVSNQP